MDKYKKHVDSKLKGQHPDLKAKEALINAEFASRQREEFFDKAYGDILADYAIEMFKTDPHETKKREFLYTCVLALGDLKGRLVSYELNGSNTQYMLSEEENG